MKNSKSTKSALAHVLATRRDKARSRMYFSALSQTGYRIGRYEDSSNRNAQHLVNDLSKTDIIVILWSRDAEQSLLFGRNLNFALLVAESVQKVRVITIALDDTPLPSKLYQFLVFEHERGATSSYQYAKFRSFLRYLDHGPSGESFDHRRPVHSALVTTGPASKKVAASRKSAQTRLKNKEAKELEARRRGTQIERLAHALRSGRLSLFCGSGVSADAGMPTWNDLLGRLVFEMMKKIAPDATGKWSTAKANQYFELATGSPLIVAKQMKVQLGEQFPKLVRDALYSDKATSGPIIGEIVELARPQRNSNSVDSIITFNFDGLIEESLQREHIAHRTIHTEGVNPDSDELAIYHVHGFLPRKGQIPNDMMLVFSEDGYHNQFLEPFSWANLIQLQKLTQNVCLLVGISLTDPNMRRLVDVAYRKGQDSTRHFIIWKAPSSKNALVRKVTQQITEQDANALGLDVIWVDDYSDIPKLLQETRKVAFPPTPVSSPAPEAPKKKTKKK